MGPNDEIGRRQQRPIGYRRNDQARVWSDAVGVRLDRLELLVGRDFSFEQLNQLDLRLRSKLAEVCLERLNEDRRGRGVPSAAIEHGEHPVLERQSGVPEVGRMFRLRIDADWTPELLCQLLGELDDLVKGWHFELPVPRVGAEVEPLTRA